MFYTLISIYNYSVSSMLFIYEIICLDNLKNAILKLDKFQIQMFPTSSMIEKEAPSKKQIPESEENSMRKNSVFVHVQLLQAKDVFVSIKSIKFNFVKYRQKNKVKIHHGIVMNVYILYKPLVIRLQKTNTYQGK